MKWGITLTTAKPPSLSQEDVFDWSIEFAVIAERCGYDSVWLLEHHFTPYGLCPSSLMMAAYVLGSTNTLRVGTAVVVAPLDHPLRIAENVALLDQLSHGRLYLGLGRGGFPRDFEVFGADPSRSHEALYECIDVLMRAWRQNKVGNDGPVVRFPEVSIYLRPYTRPTPPIWVAGQSSSTVEWAAQHAVPLLLPSTLRDEETRARMELYNDTAQRAGHDPATIEHVLLCVGFVADSRKQAQDALIDNLTWWSNEGTRAGFHIEDLRHLPNYSFHYRTMAQAALSGENTESILRRWLNANPVGTPDQCAERLEELIALSGASHVVLSMEAVADRHAISDNITRFSSEVLAQVGTG
jgi:alkanal monooxygenase alpha chain